MKAEGVIFAGTDQGVRMPPAREPIKSMAMRSTLNFEEAPLSEVVHSVLGDLLELDYIVEHPVKGARDAAYSVPYSARAVVAYFRVSASQPWRTDGPWPE